MSMVHEETENWRVTFDEFNERCRHEEWKCKGCGEWVDDGDTVWSMPDGVLNTDKGDPYCCSCVPDEL